MGYEEDTLKFGNAAHVATCVDCGTDRTVVSSHKCPECGSTRVTIHPNPGNGLSAPPKSTGLPIDEPEEDIMNPPLVQCSNCYTMRKKSRSHVDCPRCGSLALTNHNNPAPATGLPTDAAARKAVPIFSGVLKYFPDALAAVAELSKVGNDQHNPGEPLRWAREKSGDELDALTRHLIDAGTLDSDGLRHSAKVAWRALANLQKEIEIEAGIDPNVTR